MKILGATTLFLLACGCQSAAHQVRADSPIVPIAPDVDEATFASRYQSLEPRGEEVHIDGEHHAYVVVGDPNHVPGRDRSVLEERMVVVLLSGAEGLTDFDRRWADRLGKLGYGVVAPDLGAQFAPAGAPTTPAEFEAITAAIHYSLDALELRARQVVLLGFERGAAHALRAARMDDHVTAVVAYAPPAEAKIPADRRALIFDVADADDGSELVQRVEIDAASGFQRPGTPTYDAAAADRAWRLVQAFLGDIYDPYLAVGDAP